MTRKDYILIAEVFQAHRKRYGGRTDAVVVEVISDMCAALQAENSRFDSARFLEACGIVDMYPCEKCGGVRDCEARICNGCGVQ